MGRVGGGCERAVCFPCSEGAAELFQQGSVGGGIEGWIGALHANILPCANQNKRYLFGILGGFVVSVFWVGVCGWKTPSSGLPKTGVPVGFPHWRGAAIGSACGGELVWIHHKGH